MQAYCPSDFVRFIKDARQNPGPYRIDYLDYSFFQNYTEVCGLKSIRPGRKPGDAQAADIRCLQYKPDDCIMYKLVHEDWKELIVRGNSTIIKKQPKPLFSHQRQIPLTKFKHLQEIKPVIPKDIHGFYDSLPSLSTKQNLNCFENISVFVIPFRLFCITLQK